MSPTRFAALVAEFIFSVAFRIASPCWFIISLEASICCCGLKVDAVEPSSKIFC